MEIEKITSEVKNKITSDWFNSIKELTVYKPLKLFNRLGPVCVGVDLEIQRGNQSYRPFFQIVSLTSIESKNNFALPVVNMFLRTAKGAEYSVAFKFHDQNFKEAVDALTTQALIPFQGKQPIERIIEAIFTYLKPGIFIATVPFEQIEEIVRLSFLLEDDKKASKYRDKARELIDEQSKSHLEYMVGDVDIWKQKLFTLEKNEVLKCIEENIKKYNLTKLNSFD